MFYANVLTNLFGMPLNFIAAKDICLKVIRMATIGIKSSYITKLAHLYTAEDKYTTYEIENTQTLKGQIEWPNISQIQVHRFFFYLEMKTTSFHHLFFLKNKLISNL